jgi:hypothetical protein
MLTLSYNVYINANVIIYQYEYGSRPFYFIESLALSLKELELGIFTREVPWKGRVNKNRRYNE